MPEVNNSQETPEQKLGNYEKTVAESQDSKALGSVKSILNKAKSQVEEKQQENFKKFLEEKYPDSPDLSDEEKRKNLDMRNLTDPMFLDKETAAEFLKYQDAQVDVSKVRDEAIDEVIKLQGKRLANIQELTGDKNNPDKLGKIQKLEQDLELDKKKQAIDELDAEIKGIEEKIENAKTDEEKEKLSQELTPKKEELDKLTKEYQPLKDRIEKLKKGALSVYKTYSDVQDKSYNAICNIFGEENLTEKQKKELLGETKYNEKTKKDAKQKEEKQPEQEQNQPQQQEPQREAQAGANVQRGGVGAGFVAPNQAAQATQTAQAVPQQEEQVVASTMPQKSNVDFDLQWIGYDPSKPLTKSSAKAILKNFVDKPDMQMDILQDSKGRTVIIGAMEKAGKARFNLGFGKTRKALAELGDNSFPSQAVERFVERFEELSGKKPSFKTKPGNEYNEIVGWYEEELKNIENERKEKGTTPELRQKFAELQDKYAPIIGAREFKESANKNMVKTKGRLASLFAKKENKRLEAAKESEEKKEEYQTETLDTNSQKNIVQQQPEMDEHMVSETNQFKDLKDNISKMNGEEFKDLLSQAIENGDKDTLAAFNNGDIELDEEKNKIFENAMSNRTKENDGHREGYNEREAEMLENMEDARKNTLGYKAKEAINDAKQKYNESRFGRSINTIQKGIKEEGVLKTIYKHGGKGEPLTEENHEESKGDNYSNFRNEIDSQTNTRQDVAKQEAEKMKKEENYEELYKNGELLNFSRKDIEKIAKENPALYKVIRYDIQKALGEKAKLSPSEQRMKEYIDSIDFGELQKNR